MRLRRRDRESATVPPPTPPEPPEQSDSADTARIEDVGTEPVNPVMNPEPQPAALLASSGPPGSPVSSDPADPAGVASASIGDPAPLSGAPASPSDGSLGADTEEQEVATPPSEASTQEVSESSPEAPSASATTSDIDAGPEDGSIDAGSEARPTEPETELGMVPEPDETPQPAPVAQATSGRSRSRTTRAPSIPEEAEELLNGKRPAVRDLPRVIAVANQKGGVGKTTTTVNLGAALAERDYRVLVVDLDPQGNATTGLGVEARNFEFSMYDVIMRDHPLEDTIEPTSVKNLFVAPATIDLAGIEIELVPAFSREMKLKRAVDSVVEDFDFVLIDCPPSLGLITVNGLAAADEVLVPIQCEYYALEGLSQLLRNVHLVSTNLNETLEVTTIVLTMYDARTRLSVDVANEVREHFSERVCKVVIPRTVRLSEAPSFGQPITVFDPSSRGAVAYRELAKEVSNGAPQRTR
jgi:chromosome partitioning protein